MICPNSQNWVLYKYLLLPEAYEGNEAKDSPHSSFITLETEVDMNHEPF